MTTEIKKTLATILMNTDDILKKVALAGGEISEELEAELESNSQDLSVKLTGYCALIKATPFKIAMLKDAISELTATVRVMENFEATMKERVKYALGTRQIDKLETDHYDISLRASNPKLCVDENLLPATYLLEKVVVSVDTDRIKAELKAGKEIPGAKLESGKSLFIKARG